MSGGDSAPRHVRLAVFVGPDLGPAFSPTFRLHQGAALQQIYSYNLATAPCAATRSIAMAGFGNPALHQRNGAQGGDSPGIGRHA